MADFFCEICHFACVKSAGGSGLVFCFDDADRALQRSIFGLGLGCAARLICHNGGLVFSHFEYGGAAADAKPAADAARINFNFQFKNLLDARKTSFQVGCCKMA